MRGRPKLNVVEWKPKELVRLADTTACLHRLPLDDVLQHILAGRCDVLADDFFLGNLLDRVRTTDRRESGGDDR